MRLAARNVAMVMAGALALAACETNEQIGQAIGGILGAGLGYAVAGDDDDTMKAIAVVAGAGLGSWIGGNLGRGLDERERERVAVSTEDMLAMEVPGNSPLRAPGGQSAAYAPSSSWTSPTNPDSVSGKSSLVKVDTAGGAGECRTVRQLVVKNGREITEETRFCRPNPSSPWTPT